MTDEIKQNSYEIKLRILGNEIFAIALSASDGSNRWAAIGIVTIFSMLTVIGAYGEKFVTLFKWLTG